MKKGCRNNQSCSKQEQVNLEFARELDAKNQLQHNKGCKDGCSKR
jgi:hypothetical protein